MRFMIADELVKEDDEIEFVRINDDVFMSVTDRMPLPYIGTSQLKIEDPLSDATASLGKDYSQN